MKNWKLYIPSSLILIFCISFTQNNFAQISIDFDMTSPTCNGYTNGQLTANPSGGTPPYQYFWNNGQPSQTIFGLTGGNYSITVSDADGTTAIFNVMLPQPEAINVSIAADGAICNGNNQSFTATVNGGTAPYNYQWSDGSTSSTIDNPVAGYYFVTITDSNNCHGIGGMSINEPLSVEVVTIDVACFGLCDGSVEAIATGGTTPYSYLWNNGSTEAIQDMLPPGDYTVTVTDDNGCTAIGMGTIGEPTPLVADIEVIGQCTGNSGINVSVTGNFPPYIYQWGHGPTTPNLTNLVQGTYFLTVTANEVCKLDTFIVISGGTTATITEKTDATCLGANDGLATVTIIDGVGPFGINWSTIPTQTTATATNLAPGEYFVTITDAGGCTAVDSVIIGQNIILDMEISQTDELCDGTGGTATVIDIINGVPPFTYQWNTNPMQTNQMATDLTAGVYTLTVTDANGCIVIDSVVIAPPNALTILVQVDNTNCEDTSEGSINIVNVGPNAVAPLTYEWCHDENATSASVNNLPTGFYCVTVTDADGCTGALDSIFIDVESTIDAAFLWEIDTCVGDSILLNFADNSSFTPTTSSIDSWQWLFNNGVTSNDAMVEFYTNIDTLIATLIVSNSNGCSDTITESIPFDLGCDLYPDTLFVCENDTLMIQPNNTCSGIIAYEWMPAAEIISGQNTATPSIIGGNQNIILSVDIANDLGCTFMESVFVEVVQVEKQLTEDDIITNQCDSTQIDFTVTDNAIACYTWLFDYPNLDEMGQGPEPSFLYPTAGTYTVALVPNVPCLDTVFKIITVAEPPLPDFNIEFEPCQEVVTVNFLDISTTPTPITSWSWSFSNGITANTQNTSLEIDSCQELTAQLIIDFPMGCSDTINKSVYIPVFDNSLILTDTLVVCESGDTISLNPNGDPTLTYEWSPADNLDDPTAINPLATITETTLFSVVITSTDCLEPCSTVLQVLVVLADELNLMLPEDIVVCEPNEETITATTDALALFEWSDEADFSNILQSTVGFSNINNLDFLVSDTTMLYTKATDQYGCMEIDSILVGNYEVLANPIDELNVCFEDAIGIIPIEDLSPNDSLIWSPENPTGITPTESGTFVYTLDIINDQGCTAQDELTVTVQNINEDLTVIPTIDTIIRGQSVAIEATFDGDYIYQWTPEEGLNDPTVFNPVALPTDATTYNLLVTDETTGCRGEDSTFICVVEERCGDPMIFVPNVFTPNNDGLNDVLYVRGLNIRTLNWIIYNRWGEKVFESRSVDKGWDGTFGGKLVSGDVYGYYLEVTCEVGGQYAAKGNVTVIR